MSYQQRVFVLAICATFAAAQAQAQSYSVDASGFTATLVVAGGAGALPDDIFFPKAGAPPVLPIPSTGFPGSGPAVEVDALSYGRPLSHFSATAPAHFSVDFAAISAAGTASGIEFSNPSGSEASSDVFFSSYTSTNSLVFDGNGLATGSNPAVPALALAEPVSQPPPPGTPPIPPTFDDLDGLDLRSPTPLLASPTGVIYFSLDAATAAGGVYGAGVSAADVFIGIGSSGPVYDGPGAGPTPPASPGGVPQPYAAELLLGFPTPGNDIDAVVVYDNGDGIYTSGLDIVVFSLAPGSSYLGTLDPVSSIPIEPSDILVDGGTAFALTAGATTAPIILHAGETLGLITGRSSAGAQIDNLNALDLVVPEPTSLGLVLMALAAVAGRRWLPRP